MNAGNLSVPGQGQFNTLAQIGTPDYRNSPKSPFSIVHGEGTDLTNKKRIRNRAKRKQISRVLAIKLAKIAEEMGNERLALTFWNTYRCLDIVQVSNQRVYGKYCKNRLCTVCLGIRKAEIINKYLPILQSWQEPHFVTLTVKSVLAKDLRAAMERMNYGLNRIISKYKKRNQRKGSKRLIGIRSMECNFNPKSRRYNPHFHLIVPDRETGEILIREWLSTSKPGKTIIYAQKNQRIYNNEKCLIEIVKYGSKIFTEPDTDNRKQTVSMIYAKALYTIVDAMKGHRIFDRFGFNSSLQKVEKTNQSNLYIDLMEFHYDNLKNDWMETNSKVSLTEYVPEPMLVLLLADCIDVETA